MSEKSNRKCFHEFQINLEFLQKLIALPQSKVLYYDTLKSKISFKTILTEDDKKKLSSWLTLHRIGKEHQAEEKTEEKKETKNNA